MKPLLIAVFFGLLATLGCVESPKSSHSLVPAARVDEASSNFQRDFAQDFAGFTSISAEILEKVVAEIPKQQTGWGEALHQSEAAIGIAFLNQRQKRHTIRDFAQAGSYPFAVDLNLNDSEIQAVLTPAELKAREIKADDDGRFRASALPHDLAQYIQENLPAHSLVRAQALSQADLSTEELLGIVKNNLELKMPTLLYFPGNAYILRVLLIVGYKDKDLLILEDTRADGIKRFFQTSADLIREHMKSSPANYYLSLLDAFATKTRLRAVIEKTGGSMADSERIKLWQDYSLIKFERSKSAPVL